MLALRGAPQSTTRARREPVTRRAAEQDATPPSDDRESLYLNVRVSLESCGLGLFFGARTGSGDVAA